MTMARFVAGADTDLVNIWLYIARKNPSAADRTWASIRAVCDILAQNPELGELQPDLLANLRRFVVESYAEFYRPTIEGVEVLEPIPILNIRPLGA